MSAQWIVSFPLTLTLLVLTACLPGNLLRGEPGASHCDRRTLITSKTQCRSCTLNKRIQCPNGYTKVTNNTGTKDCRFYIPLRIYSLAVSGCRHTCVKEVVDVECCAGYWGPDCMECPGGAASPCRRKGVCIDGMGGTGMCNCMDGFAGVACEKCAKETSYGPDCSSECECVHGDCNSGIAGDGTCTCYSGYTGAKCDEPIPACRALQCPENTRCSEEATTGKLVCECLPGYHTQGSTKCEPINPCLQNPCGSNAICTYLGPNTFTCTCQEGYRGDGQVCLPIDPCQNNYGNCPTNSTVCHYDGPGKSHCQCQEGYENLLAGIGCELTDVCKSNNTCDKNANCATVAPGQIECSCNEGYTGDGSVCYGSIMERIKDLNTQSRGPWQGQLTSAMLFFGTGYAKPLTNLGPFTLFLPTNKAFKAVDLNRILADKDRTQYLAKLHIIAGQLSIADLNVTDSFYTLTGRSGVTILREKTNQLKLRIYGNSKKARILTGNVIASNGLLHIIDKVMDGIEPTVKSSKEKSLYTIISENRKFKRFMELLQKCDLDQLLKSSGTFTVFVPSSSALDGMKDGRLDYLLSAEGKQKLKELVKHHIIPGTELEVSSLLSSPTILSLANQRVTLNVSYNGQILLGDHGAAIDDTDILGKNGRIYSLTGVLVPPSIVPILPHRCDDKTYRVTKGACGSCAKIFLSSCPSGMAPMDTFSHGCFYVSNMIGLQLPTQGCSRNCNETVIIPKCCRGFYGPDCRQCPGGFQNPCSGNGQCVDGLDGNGTCLCDDKFTGSKCHLCSHPHKYGPNCDQTCRCVHGKCDNSVTGNGACKVNSCTSRYSGVFCERQTMPCGPSVQFCHAHANCEYKNGTLSCVCKPNFEGDGSYCEEASVCRQPDRGGCNRNAECITTGTGSYLCRCLPGWTGNGEDCTEINNCLLESRGGCHIDANCIYLGPGQSDCECKKGFRGNGIECEPINPCLEYNGGCHYLATCTYTSPGIRSCTCQKGYDGNGIICYGNAVMALSLIPDAAEFLKWVNDASQNKLLSETANITLLVPTQKAIDGMDSDKRAFWLKAEQLPNLVKYHVIQGVYSLTELLNCSSYSLATITSGVSLSLTKTNKNPLIGGANILNPDIALTNGVMHIIDKVLLPDQPMSDAPTNLLFTLDQMPDYSQFRTFVIQQNLTEQIESASTYTVYAPNNEAIEKYLKEKSVDVMDEDLIRYHIILDQKLMKSDMHNGMHRETMLGFSFQVGFFCRNDELSVNDALVNFTDVETDKGVIHGLTKVLEIQKNRCDTNETTVTQGKCTNCQYKPECPPGYRPMVGKKKNCIFVRYLLGKRLMYLGCQTTCVKTVITRECCAGYFGKQCQACPGRSTNWCFGNGICQDGINGTGTCECEEGFTGTACETCIDGEYGIHCDQECRCVHGKCNKGINGDGTCECDLGWKGINCDVQITNDQCNKSCHSSANCISEISSNPYCKCATGFKGNGTFCEAVNACETNNGGCSPNADCKITLPGKRDCLCRTGYTGDGLICIGINPCLENNGGCHTNAECTQTGPNQAACNCLTGYQGDGKTCEPVNPCRVDNGGCSEFASCNHTGPNERVCSCVTSYVGDGFTCKGTIYKEMTRNTASSRFFYHLQLNGITELGGLGPFTVFVPSNEAFKNEAKIPDWTANGQMAQILRYHIVACNQVLYNQLISKKSLITVHGETIQFSYVKNTLYLNKNARIINSDIINANGVVHFIDKLLSPQNMQIIPKDGGSYKYLNLTSLAAQNGYSIFSNLLEETNLLSMINDPMHRPVTLFLPKDSVMKSLSKTRKNFLYNKDNRKVLIEYLKFHIIRDAKILAAALPKVDSLKTLQGSDIRISCARQRNKGELYLNRRNCKITQRYLEFDAGVAYGIGCLMTPQNIGARCDDLSLVDILGDCGSCLNTPACPSGSRPKAEKKECTYQNFFHADVDGCQYECTFVIWKPKCCSNYFGKNCKACPGGPETPCNSHGVCDDQYTGTGNCSCSAGFNGTACELCLPGHWGSECTACDCTENGVCDDGFNGQGICFCNEGWTGDRCETQLAMKPVCSPPCSKDAICKINNTCECKLYYEGDGRTCDVVDQCAQDNGGCSDFAKCSQNGVKVQCRCEKEYSGDGYTCIPKDPCADGVNGGCHEHAICTVMGANRRKCACKDNYIGDGTNCTVKQLLVNRCVQDNGKCHADANCADLHYEDKTVGVFHLQSEKGQYELNYLAAQKLCKAEEAVLATYNQLAYAQQAGYHLCSAGWLDGQRVSYPTSYSNPNCGSGHVGIVDYGPRANISETWDAYCYRMKDVQCTCKKGYVGNGYSCNGNLLQVLTSVDKFSTFLTKLLNYSNTTENGRRFVEVLTDLSVKGTLFVPVNSGFYENVTLSGRDIEYHFSNLSSYIYHKMENGTLIRSTIGHALLITTARTTLPPSPEFSQQIGKLVNDRPIVAWDIVASNGIIHAIDKPLQAPLEPVKPHAVHTGAGVGIFFACTLVIAAFALAVYCYHKHRRGPFSFQYFKSEEGEGVSSFDDSVPNRFSNPMYNKFTNSTDSGTDPFCDEHHLGTNNGDQQ
ncbi:stabilin-2-like isoform X1 [Rhincodon typus]|uniref:stabilin-2-like isoform X1 n=3 Tax=Rhincodon typus TaxID=259920 RepID=UPI002030A855|nr:stabilin-2-like isoform X1 [Rhincodon typus]